MKALAIALITAVALTACSPRIVREAYPVPVPYVPEIPDVKRPVIDVDSVPTPLDLSKLSEQEKGAYIKAYRLSAESWKQYAEELERVVDELRGVHDDVKPVSDNLIETIRQINAAAADDLAKIKAKAEQ